MAQEADAVIVALEAQVGGFNRDVKGAAQVFDRAASDIEKSATRTENAIVHSSGRIANAQRNLGRQFSDIGVQLSSGQSWTMVLSQQLPQIADALADTEGKAASFARFLGNPWVAAGLAAASVLATLIASNVKFGSATDALVEKMRAQERQSALNDKAAAIYAHTIEGLTAAIREQREEQERAIVTERAAERQALLNAQARQKELQGKRDNLAADLASRQADRATLAKNLGGPRGEATSQAVQQLDQQIASLQAQIAAIDNSLRDAATNIRGAEQPLVAGDVANAFDKRAAAVARYTAELEKLNLQVTIGEGNTRSVPDYGPDGKFRPNLLRGISSEEYRRQLTRITAERDAALKAIAEAEQAARASNEQFGRSVTSAEARAIAERAGFRVTSANRTRAEQQRLYNTVRTPENPVAVPGTSAHERGNALDIAFGPGVSVVSIRKAFAEQGVRLTKILKESGHFHVEFSNEAGKEIERQAEATSKAVKKLAGDTKEQFAALEKGARSVEDRLDPAAAAARQFREELKTIEDARLAGIITDVRALELRFLALAKAVKPIFTTTKNAIAETERLTRQNQRDAKPGLADRKDALDAAQRDAEGRIYDLANLYEELFTGGTKNLWEAFKREGLRALAVLAAQETFKLITGQDVKIGSRGGGGDLFNLLSSAASSVFGGGGGGGGTDAGKALGLFKSITGRASGGWAAPGSVHRVNEHTGGVELLRLGSEGGTIIPLGQTRAASPAQAGPTVVHQHFVLDARFGVTTPQLLEHVNDVARRAAGQGGAIAYTASLRDMPGTLQQLGTLKR